MKLGKLLTHDYPIEDIKRAFDDLENGKVGRASVKLQPHKRMNDHH
jgi:Zn-dependent alcohol dehydrogenase